MARIRTIKPEFFTSPDTAKASIEARLFYIALWCWADDWGVGEANMNALLGFAFPEDDEKTRKEIQSLCKEVANTYGTLFYENNGRYFYQIPAWEDHQKTQRRAKRRNPTADDPGSRPDKRIYDKHATSEFTQGNSEITQGNDQEGTGEHRNIGTGEREQGNVEPTGSLSIIKDDDDTQSTTPEFPEEVKALSQRLANWIVQNGNRKPNVTKTWHQAIDRLNRIDGYEYDQIAMVIDWSQQSEFWQGNILSTKKLREKFDTLKNQMFQDQRKQHNQRPTAKTRMHESAQLIQRLQYEQDQQQTSIGALE